MRIIPYSDDHMTWDEEWRRYILTESGLRAHGVNLRPMLEAGLAEDTTLDIAEFCRIVSDLIYNHIHKYSMNNMRQDAWIASYSQARQIIERAMVRQAQYMVAKGNLSQSIDASVRELDIDKSAAAVLDTVLPEIGVALTYAGC